MNTPTPAKCEKCKGEGLLELYNPGSMWTCKACSGTGLSPSPSGEDASGEYRYKPKMAPVTDDAKGVRRYRAHTLREMEHVPSATVDVVLASDYDALAAQVERRTIAHAATERQACRLAEQLEAANKRAATAETALANIEVAFANTDYTDRDSEDHFEAIRALAIAALRGEK